MTMSQTRQFSGYSVDGVHYLTIQVKDSKIFTIQESIKERGPDIKTYIAPGLIDTQVNGYMSVSFNNKGLTPGKIKTLTEALWKEGVTTFFPTIITNPPELVNDNLRILSGTVKDPLMGHVIPGYFLEGPYISPVDGFRGAHDREWVRKPDWDEFMSFYNSAEGKIIQIGLAPELDGAMEFIKKCIDLGVMVSLAHHNGSAEQIGQAVDLGARVSTHLGNGCANMIPRHNNPLWPQLAEERLTPSIIADGHHLTKAELQVFFKMKGPDNLMLVSDATELAGMPPGEYNWNGKTVVVTDDGMLQYPEQQVLAGASFPIRSGVMNMVKLAGCSLPDAIHMATAVPARTYGMKDRGVLEEGKSADLIIFSIEDGQMVIRKTIVAGETVYNKENE